MTKLPSITKKQETILQLVARFRFLNRIQIQQLLNHKDYKTINAWLRDLTNKEYLTRLYTKTFPENTKPAIYYLAPKGIHYLKVLNGSNTDQLQKLYRESQRTTAFINTCLLTAAIYLDLRVRGNEKVRFTMHIKSDYPSHPYANLLNSLSPHAFIEQEANGQTKRYFLEILTDLPNAQLRQRVKKYLSFCEGGEWEAATGLPFPTVLLVCPNANVSAFVKRYAMSKIAAADTPLPVIHFALADQVSKSGITGNIWTKLT